MLSKLILTLDTDSGLIWGVCKEINNLSKNEMLYLSLDNCNSFTEVCLNDTCINVCKVEDLSGVNDFGQDNLIIYTKLKNCPIGFTQDKNLDLDIIIEDTETLEQTYYTYCRATSNYHYKKFAGQAPENNSMLQLFQGNECPFGEADVWIETANGQTIVGCYDDNSSKEFLITAEDTTDALIKAQQEAKH